jgi:hypothetical protein
MCEMTSLELELFNAKFSVKEWEAATDVLASFYPYKPRTQIKAQAQLMLEAIVRLRT